MPVFANGSEGVELGEALADLLKGVDVHDGDRVEVGTLEQIEDVGVLLLGQVHDFAYEIKMGRQAQQLPRMYSP